MAAEVKYQQPFAKMYYFLVEQIFDSTLDPQMAYSMNISVSVMDVDSDQHAQDSLFRD